MRGIDRVWDIAARRARAEEKRTDVWLAYQAGVSASLVRYWKRKGGISDLSKACVVSDLTGIDVRELQPTKAERPGPPPSSDSDGHGGASATTKAHGSRRASSQSSPVRNVAQLPEPRLMGNVRSASARRRNTSPCKFSILTRPPLDVAA